MPTEAGVRLVKVRHMVFSKVSLRHEKSIMRSARYLQPNRVQAQKPKWWGLALRAAVLCLWASALWAGNPTGYGNPAVGNPIGPGTVPPSAYESPLVRTPNPIDTTNNRVITGNVSGGKFFHGIIPYGSTTRFAAPLGSTTLDSFLRYSDPADEVGGYPGAYSPFYSPSGTVAGMQPGYQAVFAPASPKVATGLPSLPIERPADVMALADVPQTQVPLAQTNSALDNSIGTWQAPLNPAMPRPLYPPMLRTPDDMRQLAPDESTTLPTDQRLPQQSTDLLTSEEYRRQLEQLQGEIEKVKANASELEQSLQTNDGAPATASVGAKDYSPVPTEAVPSSRPSATASGTMSPQPESRGQPSTSRLPDTRLPQIPQPWERPASPDPLRNQSIARLLNPVPLPGQEQADSAQTAGALQLQPQLDSPLTSPPPTLSQPAAPRDRIDALFSTQGQPGAARVGANNYSPAPAPEFPALQRVKETARAFDTPSDFLQRPSRSVTGGEASPPDRGAAPGSGRDDGTQTQAQSAAPLPGSQVPPKYGIGKLGSLSQEKFEHYMQAAEQYMRQGRYYRATDSFTLAAAYRPDDARPYLGRSRALFAAGEYLSSAVLLAQAIQLDPRSTLGRTDLANAVGGPELFASRMVDLEQCVKTANAPQLQFLLAYVYYQMGRPAEAKIALATAEKALPPSPCVTLLKAALGP